MRLALSQGSTIAFVIGDLQIHGKGRVPGAFLHVQPGFGLDLQHFRFERADGPQRRHLGHAPGVKHVDAIVMSWNFSITARGQDDPPITTRSSDERALALGFEVLQQQEARSLARRL